MKIIKNLIDWQKERERIPANSSIGFVPTMGNLHQGHGSLYEISKKENTITVASIFVNPTQFNSQKDFHNYPKTLEADLNFLQSLGVDYCLMPSETDMYPDGYCYRIQEIEHSLPLEGKCRPGHFDGVLTIVLKLLNLVQPTRAYFGEKDYQQYQLIKGMIVAFFMKMEIKLCPTIREKSGLAHSSRNNRLNINQKQLAEQFAQCFHQKQQTLQEIKEQLVHLNIEIDYLEEVEGRRFAAIKIDEIRLIDNYLI